MDLRRRSLRAPLALVATALAVRLAHLWAMASGSPFFDQPVVDAYTYAQQARAIAAGHWLDFEPGAFWQPPLYPWFLGAVERLSGERIYIAARLAQALLGALSCALLFEIGRRAFSRAVGLAAGLALAFCGPAVYFDGELLPASLALFLVLSLLLSLPGAASGPGRWLLSGSLLGLAALCVPTALALAPAAALWLWTRPPSRRARCLVAFAVGAAAVVAPVTARNALIGGDAVLISWNGGVNFFLGNNPDYPHTTRIRPGQPWLDLMARADSAGCAPGSDHSRFFYAEALGFIRRDPTAWLGILVDKAAVLGRGEEVGRNQSPYLARHHSPPLALLLWREPIYFPFGVVAPLALLGLVLAAARPGRARLLAGSALAYGGGVVLFFVTSRYRLPVVALLLPLAAVGVHWLASSTRARRRVAVAGWAAVLLTAIAANRGTAEAGVDWDTETLYNLGHAQVDGGRLRQGIQSLERAARRAPEDVDVLFSLGTAWLMAGHAENAAPILERAATLRPRRADVRLNLGNALFALERYPAALDHYRAGLEVRPGDPVLTQGAARTAARAGQLAEAIHHYRRWREVDNTALEPCLAMGYCYARTARPDSALVFYESALRLDPDHLTALVEAAALLLDAGRPDEARQRLDHAARLHPGVARVDSVYDRLRAGASR